MLDNSRLVPDFIDGTREAAIYSEPCELAVPHRVSSLSATLRALAVLSER
jgi:hypothetical protein